MTICKNPRPNGQLCGAVKFSLNASHNARHSAELARNILACERCDMADRWPSRKKGTSRA